VAATLACGGTPSAPGSVVLVVIDTLRADRLGFMGYAAARTPRLDALARGGTAFTRAATPVPVTLPAFASLLTGREPFRHGVRDNDHYVLAAGEHTLAERFRERGFRTGAVLASAVVAADRGLDQGFEVYDDAFSGPYPIYQDELAPFAEEFGNTRRRADTVTDLALRMLDGFGDEPFFLLVHYFDPHATYDPPPKYAALHPGNRYDGEISFVDAELGRFLDRLARRPDALVVVVADHGESLGEHGEPEHGFLLYQPTLHVPWVVAGPGVPPGAVRDDPVTLIDLDPTLASLFSLPPPSRERDGRALRWDEPAPAGRPIYAETFRTLVSYGWSELRAIRVGDRKLIRGPEDELYDLARDPRETENLISRDPGRDLARALTTATGGETREEALAALAGETDSERRRALESLGYVGGEGGGSAAAESYPHPRDEIGRWLRTQEIRVLFRRGLVLAGGGRLAEAVAIFDSVLAAGEERPDVYYNRGLARRKLGDDAGYRADLERALGMDPDYVPALHALASRREEEGNAEEALALRERILAADPAHVPSLQRTAERHLERGEIREALTALRALVAAAPEDPSARLNLGLLAWRTGNRGQAAPHLERFLELAPGHPRAQEVRRLLEGS